jgi:hypothetical protein
MAHEVLRNAAVVIEAGWSQGTDARDGAGRPVPLFAGAGRASVNPAAEMFSLYGAICKAASMTPKPQLTPRMWFVLKSLAERRARMAQLAHGAVLRFGLVLRFGFRDGVSHDAV